mmetsp:Transcript_41223/g.86549  ORF Transcript_41223/g.86549 Transcript_41223/m.86549 type:complete len:210 (+) Transcript_41223:82-711(+)
MDGDSDDSWDFLTYTRGPSCIPGLTGSDVIQGSIGRGKNGHSLYEQDAEDKRILMDPELAARVAFWLRPKVFSLKDVKMECKSRGIPVTGNKKVLALRLAFENLPVDVGSSVCNGYAITRSSPNKQGGKRVKMSAMANASTATTAATAKKRSIPAEKVANTKKLSIPDRSSQTKQYTNRGYKVQGVQRGRLCGAMRRQELQRRDATLRL